ncbi:hypothetical protein DV737_g1833, partial [Chaetothyriales sp. CBS 132003]
MWFSLFGTVALLGLLPAVYSQTYTDCSPLNKTCPPDQGLGISNYTIDFTSSMMSDRVWNTTAGSISYDDDGAQFVISQRGDAPTVKTNFYIFFGQVEVHLKAAKGQGIVSSIVLQSDDLDEVDWEWIGGNSTHLQTNYFGKGNTTSYDRAKWIAVDDPQDNFHNYTVNWTSEKLEWYVDTKLIRTLDYSDADGGHTFPQTPCDVRLGIWAGGDPKNANGTIEWAGGVVDYDDVPFTMVVSKVRVSDASTGTTYTYGDHTGDWQSIKISNSSSAIKLDGANSESSVQSVKQKWNGLSKTAKIAIVSSVGGVALVCAAVFAFCCFKQRRAGRHERLIEDAKFEKDTAELLAYRTEMSRLRSQKLAEARASPVPPSTMPISGPGVSPSAGNPAYGYSSYTYPQGNFGNRGAAGGYQRF